MNKNAVKDAAHKAFQENRLSDARESFAKLCAKDATDADSWQLLGATHGQLGEFAEAERCFRKVIELVPMAASAWDNLGITLMNQQLLDEAEKCFRHALQLQPGAPSTHLNLGNLLRLKGLYAEAAICLQTSLTASPDFAEAYNSLAILRFEQGDSDGAIGYARRAVSIDPRCAEAYHNLGDALCAKGQFDEAMACYQSALRLNPAQLQTYISMSGLLEQVNRNDDAISCLTQVLYKQPDHILAHLNLARLQSAKQRFDIAQQHYRAVLQTNPKSGEAIAGIAGLLAYEKKYHAAYELLLPLLQRDTDELPVILAYANISHHIGQVNDALTRLERFAAESRLPEIRRGNLYFAIARLYERLNVHDQAFRYSQRANAVRPLPSDLNDHLQQMERIRSVFSSASRSLIPYASQRSQRPVFIVGMPRSGTSLVEQILASHPQVYGGGEFTTLWNLVNALPELAGTRTPYPACVTQLPQAVIDRVANDYLSTLNSLAPDALRITDKLPHNFLHLGLIAHLFPAAHVIHCTRNPLDTCVSIFFHDFNLNNLYARDLNELGRYYRAYTHLMQHWKRESNIAFLEVNYETLVAHTDVTTKGIVEFCGLTWDERCLRFFDNERTVHTPSHEQVRRPIYGSAIGRWKHYAAFLEPLKAGLGDLA